MVISVRTLMESNFIRTTMDGKGWLLQYDRMVIAGRQLMESNFMRALIEAYSSKYADRGSFQ